MASKKLYPYWEEIFENLDEYSNNLEELERVFTDPAALNRLPGPNLDKEVLQSNLELRNVEVSQIAMEFQMAIRARVKIYPRYISILLWDSILRSLEGGLDISLYFGMFYLMELGRKEIQHHHTDDSFFSLRFHGQLIFSLSRRP